jgi:hypothetical protein
LRISQKYRLTIAANILFAAIDFFVVLSSLVITLKPRDWRGRPAKSVCIRWAGAFLFAAVSKRMIRTAPQGADLMERPIYRR